MHEQEKESKEYEAPVVVDHGDLMKLTAAGQPHGHFDANYRQGQPIPPGGAGSQP